MNKIMLILITATSLWSQDGPDKNEKVDDLIKKRIEIAWSIVGVEGERYKMGLVGIEVVRDSEISAIKIELEYAANNNDKVEKLEKIISKLEEKYTMVKDRSKAIPDSGLERNVLDELLKYKIEKLRILKSVEVK